MKLSLRGLFVYAKRHQISNVEALIEATGCCTGCGSCRPFVEEMLRTGHVPQTEGVPRVTDIIHLYPPE